MSSRFFGRRSVAVGALAIAAPVAVALATAVPGGSALASAVPAKAAPNTFVQTNLVSNLKTEHAKLVDPNLKNPWGLAFGPATPLWSANNNSGTATLYSITPGGQAVTATKFPGLTGPVVVTLPKGGATSDGQVFNGTASFPVNPADKSSPPALFIFSSEDGAITGWNPTVNTIAANGTSTATVEFQSKTAVYKGLALATNDEGSFLYATNFRNGRVDVYDSKFQPVQSDGGFRDSSLPRGYAPFGIQNINGLIYVTYALQDKAKHDDVAGPGHGFIDVYTTNGFLVKRLVSGGDLDSPWGLAVAPSHFGAFGGKLLVGNFGNGKIHAYDLFTGKAWGPVLDTHHHSITIQGLWGLKFGTAATGGTNTLLFSAGIHDEADGLLGSINVAK
jgi:uncharacterized protein (TIGR03118 family)